MTFVHLILYITRHNDPVYIPAAVIYIYDIDITLNTTRNASINYKNYCRVNDGNRNFFENTRSGNVFEQFIYIYRIIIDI